MKGVDTPLFGRGSSPGELQQGFGVLGVSDDQRNYFLLALHHAVMIAACIQDGRHNTGKTCLPLLNEVSSRTNDATLF